MRASDVDLNCKDFESQSGIVSITNMDELQFILNDLANGTEVLIIGLHRPAVNQPWVWVDGEPFNFNNFHGDEPNNEADRLYASMESNGDWKTNAGIDQHKFVCKIAF